jgi:hypothetical protein
VGASQSLATNIINQLEEQIGIRSENRKAWAISGTADLGPNSLVTSLSIQLYFFLLVHIMKSLERIIRP